VHGDLCETFMVGNVDEPGRKLVQVSRMCLDAAISICGPGERFSTIGNTIRYDRRTDRQMDRQTDGQTDRQIYFELSSNMFWLIHGCVCSKK